MATPPTARQEVKRRIDAIQARRDAGYDPLGVSSGKGSAVQHAARDIGVTTGTMHTTLKNEVKRRDEGKLLASCECPDPTTCPHYYLPDWYEEPPAEYEIPFMPSEQVPTGELVDRLARRSERVREVKEARKLIPVKVKISGPFGIAHFGDPHVDDPGTDWADLKRHVEIVKSTPGLFAGNVGDMQNNWVGRLARLFAKQETSHAQAWQLTEWLMTELDWLYIVKGNHDLWSGAGDPLDWIVRETGDLMDKFNLRLELQPPSGQAVRINVRHDFPGHSMWNPAHGLAKAAQLGWRDHILAAGHKHTAGYNILKDPATGLVSHALRVAGFKKHDEFALEKGFPDQNFSPCATTIINPHSETEIGLVTTIWDIENAADYLTWLRSR